MNLIDVCWKKDSGALTSTKPLLQILKVFNTVNFVRHLSVKGLEHARQAGLHNDVRRSVKDKADEVQMSLGQLLI